MQASSSSYDFKITSSNLQNNCKQRKILPVYLTAEPNLVYETSTLFTLLCSLQVGQLQVLEELLNHTLEEERHHNSSLDSRVYSVCTVISLPCHLVPNTVKQKVYKYGVLMLLQKICQLVEIKSCIM